MSEGTPTPTAAASLTDEQRQELKIRQAATAFGSFCMAQKLSDKEFLFAVMLALVPVLAAYPRTLEKQFDKALEKELKLHRKLLLQKQAEAGKKAQDIVDGTGEKSNVA